MENISEVFERFKELTNDMDKRMADLERRTAELHEGVTKLSRDADDLLYRARVIMDKGAREC